MIGCMSREREIGEWRERERKVSGETSSCLSTLRMDSLLLLVSAKSMTNYRDYGFARCSEKLEKMIWKSCETRSFALSLVPPPSHLSQQQGSLESEGRSVLMIVQHGQYLYEERIHFQPKVSRNSSNSLVSILPPSIRSSLIALLSHTRRRVSSRLEAQVRNEGKSEKGEFSLSGLRSEGEEGEGNVPII